MSRIGDFVLQMMDDSGIFEESQNECAAQKQIEHDQGLKNEHLQKTATSAGETSIRGNEEVRTQQVCGLPLF